MNRFPSRRFVHHPKSPFFLFYCFQEIRFEFQVIRLLRMKSFLLFKLSMLSAYSTDDNLMICFYFPRQKGLPKVDNLHEMWNSIRSTNTKNKISNCFLLKFLLIMFSVNAFSCIFSGASSAVNAFSRIFSGATVSVDLFEWLDMSYLGINSGWSIDTDKVLVISAINTFMHNVS